MKKTRTFIGENIKKLRVNLGWTQDELAEASGMSFSGIQSIEHGRTEGTFKSISAIANAMGVSVDEFYKDPNKKQASQKKTIGDMTPEELSKALAAIQNANQVLESVKIPKMRSMNKDEAEAEEYNKKEQLGRISDILSTLNQSELGVIEKIIITRFGGRVNRRAKVE